MSSTELAAATRFYTKLLDKMIENDARMDQMPVGSKRFRELERKNQVLYRMSMRIEQRVADTRAAA